MHIFILGGSGNVGKLVIQQALERGFKVKAIVRNPSTMPPNLTTHTGLTLIQANLLELSTNDLADHIKGCDAVVCTLGHNMSYGRVPALGVWLNPHDLVVRGTKMICEAILQLQPLTPIRFVLLNTVGVANPNGSDTTTHTRTRFEKAMVSLMSTIVPPYSDSVQSAMYINSQLGEKSEPFLEWVTVRPDGFIDGEISEYKILDSIQHPFYVPDKVTKANIAHFMCELIENDKTWQLYKFKMPIIIDTHQPEKK